MITPPIPLFFLIFSFIALPNGHIDIAKAEINIYEWYSYILYIYNTDKKFTKYFTLKSGILKVWELENLFLSYLLNFAQIKFCKKYVID